MSPSPTIAMRILSVLMRQVATAQLQQKSTSLARPHRSEEALLAREFQFQSRSTQSRIDGHDIKVVIATRLNSSGLGKIDSASRPAESKRRHFNGLTTWARHLLE